MDIHCAWRTTAMAAALVPPLLSPSSAACQLQTLGGASSVSGGASLALGRHRRQWRMPHWRINRVSAESTEAEAEADLEAPGEDPQVEPEAAKVEESEGAGGAAKDEQSETEKLVMMLKAEGSLPDVSIPIVQSALEGMEDVSDVRISTFEGLTSVSLTKKTVIQATNVASEIVDAMEKAGFRMHTLNLAIDDDE